MAGFGVNPTNGNQYSYNVSSAQSAALQAEVTETTSTEQKTTTTNTTTYTAEAPCSAGTVGTANSATISINTDIQTPVLKATSLRDESQALKDERRQELENRLNEIREEYNKLYDTIVKPYEDARDSASAKLSEINHALDQTIYGFGAYGGQDRCKYTEKDRSEAKKKLKDAEAALKKAQENYAAKTAALDAECNRIRAELDSLGAGMHMLDFITVTGTAEWLNTNTSIPTQTTAGVAATPDPYATPEPPSMY